ncbi:DNL-type zinc finger protein [Linum perenne]
MEALSSSAAAILSSSSSSSSSSSIPFFSQKRKDSSFKILRCHPSSSKNNGDNSDLRSSSSDPNESTSIVPFFNRNTLSKDDAMGLVLSAASLRGWTTGSGMEGPPAPAGAEGDSEKVSTLPWSLFTKSPRRRMRVAFTCNVCGQRTTRAINPHAYTDGTVFVQCCGCNVFHKLVDNLNLFHEMKCYVNPDFKYKDSKWDFGFRLFDAEDDDDHNDDDDGNAAYPI